MRIPEVTFTDLSVNLAGPTGNSYNRIGMIAEFDRGPANDARVISNYSSFANLYGSNSASGSLAFQAAYDQGAREFVLIRVLGRDRIATANLSFSGTVTQNSNIFLNMKFIGVPIDQGVPDLDVLVNTNPATLYTSTQSGRYWFEVTSVNTSTNVVVLRYKFIPLSDNVSTLSQVNWDGATTLSIDFDTTAPGTYVAVNNGVELSFGATGATVASTIQQFKQGNAFSVRVNSYTFTIPIDNSFIPSQIANQIASYVSGVSPIGKIDINPLNNGVIINLEPELSGSVGNRWALYFTGLAGTGITSNAVVEGGVNSPVFMTGGVNGPRSAFRDFYALDGTLILRLLALSEGSWGNQIRVSIYSLDSQRYNLTITDLEGDSYNPAFPSESYIINSYDIDQDGLLNQLKSSKFVRGIFMPKFLDRNFDSSNINKAPQRLAASNPLITDITDPSHPNNYGPAYLTNVSLEGGYNGPTPEESDYIAALKLMESQPVHIVCCPGKYGSNSLKAALIAHAENSNELEGLRIALLNASPSVNPTTAIRESQGFRSNRAVMLAGWTTYSNQPNGARFGVSPDAVYAGKLAAIPVFVGPNARRIAGPINSVIEATTNAYSSKGDLQRFTDAKIEAIAVDAALGSYNFTSAVTLSSSEAWEKVYFRRVHDMIRMDLYKFLQSYKAEPHTDSLRSEVRSAIRAYLEEKVNRGEIQSIGNIIIDASNNTAATYTNYEMNVYLEFLPINSADYIRVTMVRNSQNGQIIFAS